MQLEGYFVGVSASPGGSAVWACGRRRTTYFNPSLLFSFTGSSFCFCADYKDVKGADSIGRRKTRIIAIDALSQCIVDGKYQQAIGIAIECRRLDKLEEAITRSDNAHATISYCIDISHSFVNRREYRRDVSSLED
ncbi:unnamed protein product [Fraxinus pennsylvanica]|uniref:26S proteasome non-ATPase regulatory subunit 1/RPN2 N-terminal domain-containing protein n=1 Tax=Fraxinus pennsylvanica TaxID=56036 RepID=A0AAD1ZF88_9LAMI|nr:unnamed protein product [Fraxinus pennsylvanica]